MLPPPRRRGPRHAQWLNGTPISDVMPMAGVFDRMHQFVVDGRSSPASRQSADAWASTNPSAWRGLNIGQLHAELLRSTVCAHLDHPVNFAIAWNQATDARVGPSVRNQIAADRSAWPR